MSRGFWTRVRLPSSPPKKQGTLRRPLLFWWRYGEPARATRGSGSHPHRSRRGACSPAARCKDPAEGVFTSLCPWVIAEVAAITDSACENTLPTKASILFLRQNQYSIGHYHVRNQNDAKKQKTARILVFINTYTEPKIQNETYNECKHAKQF